MAITIRKATPADAAGVARVHIESWREAYAGIIPQPFLDSLDIQSRTKNWTTHLETPGSFAVFVAEVNGTICGIAAGGPTREDEPQAFNGEIRLIYVLQSAKGTGMGRALLQRVFQQMDQESLTNTMLWVLADNPSRGFYEHMGGKELCSKTIQIGGVDLLEVAYGWDSLNDIINTKQE